MLKTACSLLMLLIAGDTQGQLALMMQGMYAQHTDITVLMFLLQWSRSWPLLVLATTGDKILPLQLHTLRLVDALKARQKVFDFTHL